MVIAEFTVLQKQIRWRSDQLTGRTQQPVLKKITPLKGMGIGTRPLGFSRAETQEIRVLTFPRPEPRESAPPCAAKRGILSRNKRADSQIEMLLPFRQRGRPFLPFGQHMQPEHFLPQARHTVIVRCAPPETRHQCRHTDPM